VLQWGHGSYRDDGIRIKQTLARGESGQPRGTPEGALAGTDASVSDRPCGDSWRREMCIGRPHRPERSTRQEASLLKTLGKIVFTSVRDGDWEICAMDADGSKRARLTNRPAADWADVCSPDGKKIVIVSDCDGNAEIYVMDAGGSNLTSLAHDPAVDWVRGRSLVR
jgi:hypothetical protein